MQVVASRPSTGPVVLAAGGTGGHVFPAEALAASFAEVQQPLEFYTDSRGRAYGDALSALPMQEIPSASPSGKNPIRLAKTAWTILRGIGRARKLLKQSGAVGVVGFGGYPALPTVIAAQLLGLPTVVHEQNAILGRANRVLARRAKTVATTFPQTHTKTSGQTGPLVCVGNPVRPAVKDARSKPYISSTGDAAIRILVMGGSQGARILSHVLPQAIASLPEVLRSRIRMTQQCRAEDLEAARHVYEAAGVEATLATFIEDVPAQLAACQLAVTRAGASTITELGCVGRPAILLPYPFAMDNHQAANAQAMADAGGAMCIEDSEFTEANMRQVLGDLLENTEKLTDMARCARAFGQPDAAQNLRQLVVDAMNLSPLEAPSLEEKGGAA